ncbi:MULTISPECIES: RuBisCO accumulation factor 1 [unclassified Microcoleus]|uniref:RuBisCO accumulation factor 1 n=1 Tax=unclassified Microcoleus TaxID=2642155 RepID=UPI002FCE917D
MTDTPQDSLPSAPAPSTNAVDVEKLIRSLRRKEGTWVEWGQACTALQQAGWSSQKVFEATGFEPIQQNQVSVAAQVYTSMVNAGGSEEVRSHFLRKGSDILYEFRILSQTERAGAAALILAHNLDVDDARQVAKAMKEFSHFGSLPQGFTDTPGDAVAYQCWQLARQKSDLQERSRLIARGLKLASSQTARGQIEQLLVDFTVVPRREAPRLPTYRVDSEEQLPRIVPVAGKLPLTASDLIAVPLPEEIEPFRMVKFAGAGAWVAIPGWQVILKAEDPVAILEMSDRLPVPLQGKVEEVLIIADRAQRQWDAESYFLTDNAGNLELQWFETSPQLSILGRVVLVMRPKKILDEDYTKDGWQIDD